MICQAHNPILDIPAQGVAHVTVVHVRDHRGHVKRATALMRLNASEIRTLQDKAPNVEGTPSYWCRSECGRVELWPTPVDNVDIEATNVIGQSLDRQVKRPAMLVAPVAAMTEQMNKEHAANMKAMSAPVRVEFGE